MGRKISKPAKTDLIGNQASSINNDRPTEVDKRWQADMQVLRRAAEELARRRMSLRPPASSLTHDNSASSTEDTVEYWPEEDRNQAVRALYTSNPDRAASLFTIALREGTPEQRRNLGAALVGSGLVHDAIKVLSRERNENTYAALSLLFLTARTGHIGPLLNVIENHSSLELRLKLIKLMASTGEREILDAFRRLAVSKSLPAELRSAIIDSISQLASHKHDTAA
jgi:hypothetical protein